MSASILKLSSIETLDLIADPEYGFESFQKLSPVKAGITIKQALTGKHPFFDEIVLNTAIPAFSYNHKPLLLYFYEQDWKSVAQNHLRQLNAAHAGLSANNINLLVVTARSFESFRELSWNEGWSAQVFEDADNALAKLLRVYSDKSPTWGNYSGIENNIALPALYLLDSSRQVALDFSNQDIEVLLPLDAVVPALQRETASWQTQKSA